jgi:hypothetical protein
MSCGVHAIVRARIQEFLPSGFAVRQNIISCRCLVSKALSLNRQLYTKNSMAQCPCGCSVREIDFLSSSYHSTSRSSAGDFHRQSMDSAISNAQIGDMGDFVAEDNGGGSQTNASTQSRAEGDGMTTLQAKHTHSHMLDTTQLRLMRGDTLEEEHEGGHDDPYIGHEGRSVTASVLPVPNSAQVSSFASSLLSLSLSLLTS